MDIDIKKKNSSDAVEEALTGIFFFPLKIFRSHDLLLGSSMFSYLRLS